MVTSEKRDENREFGEYAEQLAHFLGDPNIARDKWTPKELAEYFHVNVQAVYYWINVGYIEAHMSLPESKNAKTTRGRYSIEWSVIDEIEQKAKQLIPEMKRHWPRMVWRSKHGMKVR